MPLDDALTALRAANPVSAQNAPLDDALIETICGKPTRAVVSQLQLRLGLLGTAGALLLPVLGRIAG